MESFDDSKRQLRDTIGKLGNKVFDNEANLTAVEDRLKQLWQESNKLVSLSQFKDLENRVLAMPTG